MAYKTQNQRPATKAWSQTPASSVDTACQQIMRSAAKSMAHDREALRRLPDIDFTTPQATALLGYTRTANTYERLQLLELAGLIEQCALKIPANLTGPGSRSLCSVWRKTEHGKNFEHGVDA